MKLPGFVPWSIKWNFTRKFFLFPIHSKLYIFLPLLGWLIVVSPSGFPAQSYLPQHDLLEFCKQEGIHLMAHQPLGGKPLAVVNPNAARPGPLFDPQVRSAYHVSSKSLRCLLRTSLLRSLRSLPSTESRRRRFCYLGRSSEALL